MKSRSIHLVFALLAVSFPALACINETGTNHRGELIEPTHLSGQNLKPRLVTPSSKEELITRSRYVIDVARKNPSFESLNNLAAVLIRHGRLSEAVNLLQFLERKYPGHYETASNLGTAYELMGRDKDALKWIAVGLKRNPEDHYGTEWLHVHILNVKLGRVTTPPSDVSILKLDFGKDAMPRRPTHLPRGNTGKPLSLFAVALALRYQLLERIEFVAAPDAMMAGLLLDWANMELLAGSVESADVLYDAAIRYGSNERKVIVLRKTEVAKILALAKTKRSVVPAQCELCVPPHLVTDER